MVVSACAREIVFIRVRAYVRARARARCVAAPADVDPIFACLSICTCLHTCALPRQHRSRALEDALNFIHVCVHSIIGNIFTVRIPEICMDL